MHNIMLVEHAKGLHDLSKVAEGCPFRQLALLLQHLFKSTTVAVLVDKVKIVDCFEHIVVFDDMWRRLKVG